MSGVTFRRGLALASVLALLGGPLLLFRLNTGPIGYYFGNHAPPGQAAYIMMRPAGHLAFVLLFLQVVLGLHRESVARWLDLPSLLPLHKRLGISTLSFALLHPLLFTWARHLRLDIPLPDSFAQVFAPDPRLNYWTFYFFFGALALYALLAAVLGGLIGPRLAPKGWRLVHGLAYPACFLAWYHCRATGAEVREQLLESVYTLMTAAVACMLLWRLGGLWFRRPGAPGSSGPPVERAGG